MEALKKKTPLSCQKEIRAARKLPSGDIIISLETPQAKTQLEENKDWIPAVFTAEAKISPRIFPVLVHGVVKGRAGFTQKAVQSCCFAGWILDRDSVEE